MTPTRAGSIPCPSSIACSRRSRRRRIPASSSRSPTARACARRRRSSAASIRRPSRCGASPSPSRTTSTSPACRPRPPAPPSPTRPRRARTVVERALAAGALLIGKTNLDQFATGLVGVRTPYPVPQERLRSDDRAGRIELGLGHRRGAGPGAVRARHRHGGLGPRAGGPQQHRRPQAIGGRGVDQGRGAGLQHARLRLGVRRHRRRRLGRLRSDRRQGRGRSLLAADRARAPRAPCRRVCVIGIPRPADQKFFGDAAAERPGAPA